MAKESFIIRQLSRQFGTAVLEEKTLLSFIKGIFSRYLQFFAMYFPMLPSMRVKLQRMRGVNIGKNVFLGSEVMLDSAYPHLIHIGDDVGIVERCMIIAHSSPTRPILEEKLIDHVAAPIYIKNGAWIAAGAIILPGVTIGENAVVTAGSVVNSDVPPYTMVFGNPARGLRKLKETA